MCVRECERVCVSVASRNLRKYNNFKNFNNPASCLDCYVIA